MIKRRKNDSGWCLCECCGAIFTSNNLELHQREFCPPVLENWKHSFVLDSVIYSSLDIIVSAEDEENYVFIPEPLIRICKLIIGEAVLILQKTKSAIKFVRPPPDRSNRSHKIFLTQKELDHLSFEVGPVEVRKIECLPCPAKEIIISIIKGDIVNNAIPPFLALKCKNQFLKIGSRIFFSFFGTELVAEVESVSALQAESDLSSSFSALSLKEQAPEISGFVQSQDFTVWKLTSNAFDNNEPEKKQVYDLSKIGGLSAIITHIQEIIKISLSSKDVGIKKPASGILLFGIHGTGKTLLANSVAYSAGINVVQIQSSEVFSKYFGESESKIKASFDEAKKIEPCIVILDEVSILCPNHKGTDQQRRICASLTSALDSIQATKARVIVIGTCSQTQAVDPALRRPGRFDYEIELPVPKVDDRKEILKCLLSSVNNQVTDSEVGDLAKVAHGFVGADLAAIINHAGTQAMLENSEIDDLPVVKIKHLQKALSFIKPSAMREVLVEVPNVLWSDIGGQDEIKLKLKQAVEWPLTHPESFARLGISPPCGVLLYGPPGCSKTMIAKALATESKLNFISVKGSELLNKYVGESEKAVNKVFYRARQVTPSIIFFDELDALAGERGNSGSSDGTNVQERVLAQLLTEMDGISPLKNVTIIAATNRPDRIDKALLRPGRLDRLIYVPLPDARTRKEIFTIRLRKTPVSPDVNVDELVNQTNGYSGAELVAICHEAALKALEEDLEAAAVSQSHFQYALRAVTPRTAKSLLQFYEKFKS